MNAESSNLVRRLVFSGGHSHRRSGEALTKVPSIEASTVTFAYAPEEQLTIPTVEASTVTFAYAPEPAIANAGCPCGLT